MQRSWISALIFACAHAGAKAGTETGAGAACMDVNAADATDVNQSASTQTCARNVIWAMATGINTQNWMYDNYTNLNNKSTFEQFQCVLWHKHTRENATDGHQCLEPCANSQVTFKGTALCTGPKTTPAPAPPAKASNDGGGFPWWGWLLIIAGVLLCLGGLAYYFLSGKKPEKKKKKKAANPPAAPAPVPTPVATTVIPMPVYQTAPVTTAVAPPVYVTQAPTTTPVYVTQAPMTTYAAPAQVVTAAPAASVSYAAPVSYAAVAYAAPVAYATAAPTAFDMIDANHDGVISRHEMGAAMR